MCRDLDGSDSSTENIPLEKDIMGLAIEGDINFSHSGMEMGH
jgi:hypothetical protein